MSRFGPGSKSAWYVVSAVGLVVVIVVVGLGLFPRLSAADDLLGGLEPAFTPARVAGTRAGSNIVSDITDMADPIATDSGTAAAEVPKLIAFVATKAGLSNDDVLAALGKNFPHTTALLQAIPLSAVTAELPKLIAFLATTLKLSEADVVTAIQTNFPGIAQLITAAPKVTAGWDKVPGTEGLTRFDGTPVTDVPSVRDYFAKDVIPVLENQRSNFDDLNSLPGGPSLIPPLLLVLGIVVIAFGLLMSRLSESTRGGAAPWAVVGVVGLVVIALVVGILQLFPRLSAGQNVLDAASPAFTKARVEGHRGAIGIVSDITDMSDPIATDSGTAAPEVPKLITFVATKSGLAEPDVLAALQKNFPHTTALLQAIPLSAVTAEIPKLVTFLATTLKLSEADVLAAVQTNFPGIAQLITAAPKVTAGWDKVPGADGLTRFDGTPVTDVPSMRDYFATDVIPMIENQRQNFDDTSTPFPVLTVFAPLLLVVGLLVTVLGAFMVIAGRRKPAGGTVAAVKAA